MSKRDAVNEAIRDIERMTMYWKAEPLKRELRDALEYLYKKGQQSKLKMNNHAAAMGMKGGSVSSEAKKAAARDREARKREKRGED